MKRFVNFKGTVTNCTDIVKCFAIISIPVILDNDIVQQRKFTLISTTAQVKNNFYPVWYHCNDAAVISCSKEVLESNASYILFYKAV